MREPNRRAKEGDEEWEGGSEEICKKLYLRSSFRNIDRWGEKLHRWKPLGGVPGDRSGSFSFLVYKQEPKRFSKRSHSLLHASTTDRDDAQRDPFISTGLLDTVDVRTKDLVLHGKERCGFFPLGRRSG